MSNPKVSVIIPVFNDPNRLRLCLQALAQQTYPKDSYEVIIVDNDSTFSIEPVVTQFDVVRTIHEKKPGSYAARNKGISIADGEIIAFTDSDCIPAPNWIEEGVSSLLSTPNCGLVAGKITLFCKDQNHPTAVELYESIMAFPQKRYIEENRYGATANVFTFMEVIRNVGLFNDRLTSGGDAEWGKRVYASGYMQIYSDEVCIKHPARSSFSELYNKIARTRLSMRSQRITKILNVYLQLLLRPPIGFIFHAWKNNQIKGIKQLFQIVCVISFERAVIIWEHSRLLLGGEPRR